QGCLRGTCLPHQFDETRIAWARRCEGIAFEVVFDPTSGQLCQRSYIIRRDVTAVWPRVHGDSTTARRDAGFRSACEVGFGFTARIAQHSDLVEVDAEQGHRDLPQAACMESAHGQARFRKTERS